MYARPRGPRAPDQQRRSSMHQVRCRSHVSGRHAGTDETNCQNAGGSAAACDDPVWAKGATSGTQASVVLVNGMTQPVLTLEANTWYRSLPNHRASPPPPPPPPPPPSPPRPIAQVSLPDGLRCSRRGALSLGGGVHHSPARQGRSLPPLDPAHHHGLLHGPRQRGWWKVQPTLLEGPAPCARLVPPARAPAAPTHPWSAA